MYPLPFPVGPHVRTTTIKLGAGVGLVLLISGAGGLLAALWCVGAGGATSRARVGDAPALMEGPSMG